MVTANKNAPPLPSTLILVLCGLIVIEYIWYMYRNADVKEPSLNLVVVDSRRTEAGNAGTTCRIPDTPVFFGPWLPSKWKPKENFQNCRGHYNKLFNVSDSGILTLLPPYKDCCIQDIIQGSNDAKYNFSECTPVSSGMSIRNRETFVVRCGNETNFDAWLPDFPAVTEKMKFWRENFPRVEDRPYNVFLFGFDSVSRAHAYRSIPKALKMMEDELNFTDFKYYHAVGSHSLPNMVAFLLGVDKKDLIQYVKLAFHDSPAISNKYDARHYVTKYLLTGKNGFIKFQERPVDYHARVLYRAMADTRDEEQQRFNDSRRSDCLSSTESSPDFLLRYALQFLRKFQDIPFFDFEWLDNAFHEDPNYLPNFEDVFLRFLQSLKGEQQILRRSLIICLTDHGLGHVVYDSSSSESFIQRRLPALFIRLPDEVMEAHPEILSALRSNSKRLTTPFDVYRTLEHLVFLKDSVNAKFQGGIPPFAPSWQNRSSLLVPIPANRTCSVVGIPPEHCLCNFIYNPGDVLQLPKMYGEKALALAISWLDATIQECKLGHLCLPWTSLRMRALGPARLVLDDKEYKQVLIPFEAPEKNATLEARVNLFLKGNTRIDNTTTGEVLSVGRTNSYEGQVDCLSQQIWEELDLREICICRDI